MRRLRLDVCPDDQANAEAVCFEAAAQTEMRAALRVCGMQPESVRACAIHFHIFDLRYTARDGIRGRHTVFIFHERAAPKDVLCAFAQLAAPRVFLTTSFSFQNLGNHAPKASSCEVSRSP